MALCKASVFTDVGKRFPHPSMEKCLLYSPTAAQQLSLTAQNTKLYVSVCLFFPLFLSVVVVVVELSGCVH